MFKASLSCIEGNARSGTSEEKEGKAHTYLVVVKMPNTKGRQEAACKYHTFVHASQGHRIRERMNELSWKTTQCMNGRGFITIKIEKYRFRRV